MSVGRAGLVDRRLQLEEEEDLHLAVARVELKRTGLCKRGEE